MKTKRISVMLLSVMMTGLVSVATAQEVSADPFLGCWSLDLDYENDKAGWMEVRQEKDYLDADVLWRWGSVEPAEFVYTGWDHLYVIRSNRVVRERGADGDPVKVHRQVFWFDLEKSGENRITGTAYFPNRDGLGAETVAFKGKRIPPVGPAPDLSRVKYGEPVELFNGKDLSGWELMGENKVSGWKATGGVLVNDPVQKAGQPHIDYGNLRTTGTFEDFNLKLEVNVPEGSNSGVYLRGIYEVQVFDSYGKPLDPHNMGALYSRITPSVSAEKPAGQWQKLDITLCNRHLTVVLNGTKIIDNQPVEGVTGGAISPDEFSPGPVFLQGDHGKVSYRNIVLTPILKP
ncbi:MAG TPA: DUF1080 domain-containing protein [Bacteroides sp.]|nr:DUF1080 domain-containing protein [Bacteroides sp.]